MVLNPGGEPIGSRRAGGSRLGCLLGLLVVAAIVYVATVVVGSEFEFRAVREAVQQEAHVSVGKSDRELREEVLERIDEFDLPRSARNLYLRRLPGGGVEISLQYADTLTFLDRWRWIRPRRIVVRERE